MNQELPYFGVVVSPSLAMGRRILRGVCQYVQSSGNCRTELLHIFEDLRFDSDVAETDGIIAQISFASHMQKVRQWGGLFVNVSNSLHEGGLRVVSDDVAVGKLAAQHLLANGYRNLVFWPMNQGSLARRFDVLRRQGFLEAAAEFQATVHPFDIGMEMLGPGEYWTLGSRYIATLPKPLGIVCANDVVALLALKHCVAAGISVPSDVAIIGVDNDQVQCDQSVVPLSSVAPDFERIGFEAARRVHAIASGRESPGADLLIPPLHIVRRRSTDYFAIEDEEVVAALKYIRAHFRESLAVDDVAGAVVMSRRSLERRFLAAMGYGPHREITRLRIEAAQQLLLQTISPMHEVARDAGFSDPKVFSELFRRATGKSPSSYRRSSVSGGDENHD